MSRAKQLLERLKEGKPEDSLKKPAKKEDDESLNDLGQLPKDGIKKDKEDKE